jgi:kinesin family protein 1
MQGYGKSGVMPRALNSIFASIANLAKSGNPELQVTVQLTFVEIYCERIIDLLSPPSARKDAAGLRIYENPIEGTAVQDAAQGRGIDCHLFA